MTENEIYKLICECYHVTTEDGIAWIHDKNYMRKKKLTQIENRKIEQPNITTKEANRICLFLQRDKFIFFDGNIFSEHDKELIRKCLNRYKKENKHLDFLKNIEDS